MGTAALAASVIASSAGRLTCHALKTLRDQSELAGTLGLDLASPRVETINFDMLRSINPDAAGWLNIPNLSMQLVVVQEGHSNRDSTYLTHDFWGNPSLLGCPFIDMRSKEPCLHTLIYGHFDASAPHAQFGPVHTAHIQDDFDRVHSVQWSTPLQGLQTYTPLLGMRVRSSYAPIQTFNFTQADSTRTGTAQASYSQAGFPQANNGAVAQERPHPASTVGTNNHTSIPPAANPQLVAFIQELMPDATAKAANLDRTLTSIQSVLSLVTCSSTQAHTPWRTILVAGSPQ